MPVDFDALPDRAAIPGIKRTPVPWLIALVLILAGGAAISIATWPVGRTTRIPWFWLRTFGLPFLLWLFLYCGWLFFQTHLRRNTLADNAAIDRKEEKLHREASVPFKVIGQSWRVSGLDDRRSAQVAGVELNLDESRGLTIPDRPFFHGNEADESRRHAVVLEWLLIEVLKPLTHCLRDMREISVCLCLESLLSPDEAKAAIAKAWDSFGLEDSRKVQLFGAMSLFSIDGWLDQIAGKSRYLAISVQLRGVISGVISTGEVEAGAAVLLERTRTKFSHEEEAVFVHRPAKVCVDSLEKGVGDALRWGGCNAESVGAVWNRGLDAGLETAFKSVKLPANMAPIAELRETIGDSGVAMPWLTLALAAAKAAGSKDAQLIVDQQDGELVAMVCRKKT
jgi:hypothetical protein